MDTLDLEKRAVYRRNVYGTSVVEFVWGLGFPIMLESTFLQLFLKHLGASDFAIGAVPALFIAGISCFPLFASYCARNYRMKRPVVLALHLCSAFSVVLFGFLLLAITATALVIPLFFLCYAIFSISIGLTIPVWLNYLVRIFPDAQTVSALGFMMLAQNTGKIVASLIMVRVVERFAFSPTSSAVVFIVTGVVFIIASLCFLITREIADPDDPPPDNGSLGQHIATTLTDIRANRRFLVFLAADLDFPVVLTIMSFYANYATLHFDVPLAVAAGAFVACIYSGSITVNIVLGAMNLLSLKQKFVLGKTITLSLLLVLIVFPSLPAFFLVSYLLGLVRAIRNMVYAPAVKNFCGKVDVTPYFSLAPILTLPVAVGYPLLFGRLLDLLAGLGADSYRVVFGISFLFICLTLVLSLYTDFTTESKATGGRPRPAACGGAGQAT